MTTYIITTIFHRQSGWVKPGTKYIYASEFSSHEDMVAWGDQLNKDHARVPYHVTTASRSTPPDVLVQSGYLADFCAFDISEIWDLYKLDGVVRTMGWR